MADGNPSGQIQEFLHVLKRRRWQIVLPALFVLTFGTCFAVIIPKKYVVDTRIMVKESRNPFDQGLRNRNESATGREMENVESHIIHFNRIERIVGKELIDQWKEYDRADLKKRAEILDAIMENLKVEKVAKNKEIGSTYFDITYKDVDGARAQAFLTQLNTGWIDDIIDSDLKDLEAELDVLQKGKEAADRAFEAANSKYIEQARLLRVSPSLPPDATDKSGSSFINFDHDMLGSYLKAQQNNETDTALAKERLANLKKSFDNEPDMIKVPVLQEGTQFRAEILAAEKSLDGLKAKLSEITALHSEYTKTKLLIEKLQQRIADYEAKEIEVSEVLRSERNPRKDELRKEVDELGRHLAELEQESSRLQEKIREYQQKVDRGAEEHGLLSTLYASKRSAEKDQNLADEQLRQKESAILLFRETTGRLYEVVKPPRATDASREPSAMLLIAFALFAGGALGLGIALVAEYGRNSYRTVSELSTVMTVPVLGTISGIVTRAQARRTGLRRTVVGVSSAVILLGVAWMTFTWYDEERRDQLPVSVVQAIDDFRLLLM